METVIAESKFDCRDRNGSEFVATLLIGDPDHNAMPHGHPEGKFSISFEPLFAERTSRGADSFQALCLSIDLVRKALRAFIAHGGTVYYHQTRTPIDLESTSLTPISEPIDRKFLADSPEAT